MKTSLVPLTVTALTATALAQSPATQSPLPASWNAAAMANATYVILDPKIEGNASLISKDQQASVLSAMRHDTAGAIQRRYPGAKVATDLNTPGVIKVTPTITAPGALVPWAKLSARMDLDLPGGQRVSLTDSFGLLTLWQQGPNAANYAFDQLAKKLP